MNEIILGDCVDILPKLPANSAQIIIADPPYNIGKNFGNNKCKMDIDKYLAWCDTWLADCLRILKPNGTMFVYGSGSEVVACQKIGLPYKAIEINATYVDLIHERLKEHLKEPFIKEDSQDLIVSE